LLAALMASAPCALTAGEADVVEARAEVAPDGSYTFIVTVRHADTGWDHYANAWEIVAPDGTVLATRTLHHPHVNEQPFTRSLAGVRLPPGTTRVIVRARDSVHEYGGAQITLDLRRLPRP
jgi:hypothetical protein